VDAIFVSFHFTLNSSKIVWGGKRKRRFLMWQGAVNCPAFRIFFPLLSYLVSFHCIKAVELEAEKDEEVRESRLYPREKQKYFSRF
jgi:hypothetical protein